MRYSQLKKSMAMHASLPITSHKEAFAEVLQELTITDSAPAARFQPFKLIYSMMSLFLGVIGIGFTIVEFSPVATLNVEMNPAYELSVNRFGRVVDVEALNDDAEESLSEINYWHESTQDVLESMVQSMFGETPNPQESAILVSFSSGEWTDLTSVKSAIDDTLTTLTITSLIIDSHQFITETTTLVTATSKTTDEFTVPIYTDSAVNDSLDSTAGYESSITTPTNTTGSIPVFSAWQYAADEYNVSILHYQIVTSVYYSYDVYTTQADFESLLALPLVELIDLYNQRPLE